MTMACTPPSSHILPLCSCLIADCQWILTTKRGVHFRAPVSPHEKTQTESATAGTLAIGERQDRLLTSSSPPSRRLARHDPTPPVAEKPTRPTTNIDNGIGKQSSETAPRDALDEG